MESISLRWRHNVEYVMTSKGLERVDKEKDDNGMKMITTVMKLLSSLEKAKNKWSVKKSKKLKNCRR